MMLATQPLLLLISDDPQLAYLIGRYCEHSGCRVRHAANVDLAIAAMPLEKPTMLLLHLLSTAPQAGWSNLLRLQQSFASETIPITVVSALADEVSARAFGAEYWLWQPVMYNDFHSVLSAARITVK